MRHIQTQKQVVAEWIDCSKLAVWSPAPSGVPSILFFAACAMCNNRATLVPVPPIQNRL